MIVKLNVRTPSVGGRDVEIECELGWSVQQVKEEIQRRCEPHPRPEDQRLVYAGKLLDNLSLLEHVLRMDDDQVKSHTVHLVCRQMSPKPEIRSQEAASQQQQGLRQRRTNNNNAEEAAAGSGAHPAAAAEIQQAPFMSQFDASAAWAAAALHQQSSGLFPGQDSSAQSHDNAFYLQQMYAQYMAQYMQYIQTAASASASAASLSATAGAIPAAFFNNNMAAAAANNDNVQPAQQAQQANAAANAAPNVVMNGAAGGAVGGAAAAGAIGAGGGAIGAMEDDEDNGGQRDVLDWFYVSCRVLVLFSIVYFYSSFARFVLVTILGLSAYLWNVGFFQRQWMQHGRVRRQEEQQQQQQEEELIRREVDEVRQAATGEANRQTGEHAEGEEADQAEQEQDSEQQQQQAQQEAAAAQQQQQPPEEAARSPLTTTFTFVTTFFSSLLPEQPQVV